MLLEARGIEKAFGRVRALRGVSFSLERGETLGVVGESGSGKSTLAKIALLLAKPDAGEVRFRGETVSGKPERALREFRRKIQIVFQDPFLSFDPRQSLGAALEEPFLIRGERRGKEVSKKVESLLASVELPARFAARRASELSGGECQRAAIARALAPEPEVLVCDEPVSALDVLVRAQILNLLLRLQKERGMSFLFVSHDLRVIRHMADRVLVMKDGEAVESAPREALFRSPQHSYTRLLLEAARLT